MASTIIHMAVAKKVNEYLHFSEQDYFIGSIAPDLAKYIGESRSCSHFLDDSLKCTPNILRYVEKYHNYMDKPFEVGYFVHLYTDKIWYGDFLNKFSFKNEQVETLDGQIKKVDPTEIKKMVYSDYMAINMYLVKKYDLDLSIFYNEVMIPNSSIEELDISNINLLLNAMGTILLEDCKKEKYLFNEDMVNKFIEDTSSEIIRFLKMLYTQKAN